MIQIHQGDQNIEVINVVIPLVRYFQSQDNQLNLVSQRMLSPKNNTTRIILDTQNLKLNTLKGSPSSTFKDPQASKEKFWSSETSFSKLIQQKSILQGQFRKLNGKPRYLLAFDKYLLMFKNPNEVQPTGILHLTSDVKFSIIREKPEITRNKKYLGKIIQLNLIKFNQFKNYSLISNEFEMIQWNQFLIQRINHFGFHDLFTVRKAIGWGGTGKVYYAKMIEKNQEVAVKALSRIKCNSDEKLKAALENEILIMRRLDHRNLIKSYGFFETENSIYMVQELIKGGSLLDILKSRQNLLKEFEVKQIMKELFIGLKYLHEKNIMHRDIKVENILLRDKKYKIIPNLINRFSQCDSVVIIDLGLAQYADQVPYIYSRCGTPGYVAPEVINQTDLERGYTTKCDIYSAGLIFYLLLTGEAAFNAQTQEDLINLNLKAQINFDSPIFDTIDFNTRNLLQNLLQKDPWIRFSAEQALSHPYFFEPRKQITSRKLELNLKKQLKTDTYGETSTPISFLSPITRNFQKNYYYKISKNKLSYSSHHNSSSQAYFLKKH